jgi:hypothetical protein
MYVFPSPEQPGTLVLVLDVFPSAGPTALFSDAVDYRFRMRPVTIAAQGAGAPFAVSEKEFTFSCRFAVPAAPKSGGQIVQEGKCTASTGQSASFRVNDEQGGKGKGLRVFAGRRLDPFFFDGVRAIQSAMARKLLFVNPGDSRQYKQNVLSIVVEVDIATIFGTDAGPLFAVVGETMTIGSISVRLEHYGRPLTKALALLPYGFDTVNPKLDIRDLFNQEDVFKLAPTYLGLYHARMNANLAGWDAMDGKTDWPLGADGTHPLTELLLANFMVVDVSKPFAEDSYLEIERAILKGTSHKTCGGRSPNDDVADTILTLVINADKGPRISDGIDQQSVKATHVFPYLAPPEANPPGAIELNVK